MSYEVCPLPLLGVSQALCAPVMACPQSIAGIKRVSDTAMMEWRGAAGKKMHVTVGVTNAKLG